MLYKNLEFLPHNIIPRGVQLDGPTSCKQFFFKALFYTINYIMLLVQWMGVIWLGDMIEKAIQ